MNNKILEQKYNYGQSILNKLNLLSDEELIDFLKSTLVNFLGNTESYVLDIIEHDYSIVKTIRNSIIEEIKISSYDFISITSLGIFYKPEYNKVKEIKISFYHLESIFNLLK